MQKIVTPKKLKILPGSSKVWHRDINGNVKLTKMADSFKRILIDALLLMFMFSSSIFSSADCDFAGATLAYFNFKNRVAIADHLFGNAGTVAFGAFNIFFFRNRLAPVAHRLFVANSPVFAVMIIAGVCFE